MNKPLLEKELYLPHPINQMIGWIDNIHSKHSCVLTRQIIATKMPISVNSSGETVTDF